MLHLLHVAQLITLRPILPMLMHTRVGIGRYDVESQSKND